MNDNNDFSRRRFIASAGLVGLAGASGAVSASTGEVVVPSKSSPSVTEGEKVWYVNALTGSDNNDGSMDAPFATPQAAWDNLPDVILHQQTIELAEGIYNTSSRPSNAASQFGRPALLMCNGKTIVSRTTRTGNTMSGGVVIRAALNAQVVLDSAVGYSTAVVYVTGQSAQVAFQDLTLRASSQPVSELIAAHRGAKVHGVNITFDASNGNAATCILAESMGSEVELKYARLLNGNGSSYGANAMVDSAILLSTDTQYDDGTFRHSCSGNSYLAFVDSGTLLSPVVVYNSVLNIVGQSSTQAVDIKNTIELQSASATMTYASFSSEGKLVSHSSSVRSDTVTFVEPWQLHTSMLTAKSTVNQSAVAPVKLYSGSSIDTSLGGNQLDNIGVFDCVLHGDEQVITVPLSSHTVSINGNGANRIGCELDASEFSDGSILYVEGSTWGCQFVGGQHMYLNKPLNIGNGQGYYSGATFVKVNGKLRLVAVGQLN
ncbi:hypothetical protein [Pseudoalteromonas ardens]|uniref:DUF1565 domain-containing protein n=1 Tax=Pseudoalteromonas rubra TaxID=43658 RepID=A0A0L0EY69_9GAMM|nr:hypothetical protein [Pseudoalteromonas sp. R96]KNC68758.1 hypothetical protein AC626_02790 [Pseudoalteromonas rubra]MDK1310064.1 hypothetical protein [Pseudoalteromonas sp. R96]